MHRWNKASGYLTPYLSCIGDTKPKGARQIGPAAPRTCAPRLPVLGWCLLSYQMGPLHEHGAHGGKGKASIEITGLHQIPSRGWLNLPECRSTAHSQAECRCTAHSLAECRCTVHETSQRRPRSVGTEGLVGPDLAQGQLPREGWEGTGHCPLSASGSLAPRPHTGSSPPPGTQTAGSASAQAPLHPLPALLPLPAAVAGAAQTSTGSTQTRPAPVGMHGGWDCLLVSTVHVAWEGRAREPISGRHGEHSRAAPLRQARGGLCL